MDSSNIYERFLCKTRISSTNNSYENTSTFQLEVAVNLYILHILHPRLGWIPFQYIQYAFGICSYQKLPFEIICIKNMKK